MRWPPPSSPCRSKVRRKDIESDWGRRVKASTEATGELVTRAYFDTVLAQLDSRLAWRRQRNSVRVREEDSPYGAAASE